MCICSPSVGVPQHVVSVFDSLQERLRGRGEGRVKAQGCWYWLQVSVEAQVSWFIHFRKVPRGKGQTVLT